MSSYSHPPPPPPEDRDYYEYDRPEPPPAGGRTRDGMGIAALVLGLVSLVVFWTALLGIVAGVLAVVFGVVGHRRARRGEAGNGWMALTGAVTGFVGLVLSAAVVAAGVAFLNSDEFGDFRQCMRDADTAVEQDRCAKDLGDRFW